MGYYIIGFAIGCAVMAAPLGLVIGAAAMKAGGPGGRGGPPRALTPRKVTQLASGGSLRA